MDAQDWLVSESEAGMRLDVALARHLGVTRSRAAKMIEAGLVTIGGRQAVPSRILHTNDAVMTVLSAPAAVPESEPGSVPDIRESIVFEDAHLIVINKPRGLVVHPAPGHPDGTLVNAVLAHADDLSGIGGEHRPGIVHRLDKDTTGLIVVAKTDRAHLSIQEQIQTRTAERVYTGVVWGSPAFHTATVDACIGRHPHDRKRMAVLPEGAPGARKAVTDIAVIHRRGPFAEISARLQTGRTHQIRAHCAYIGHPIVADAAYGGCRRAPMDKLTPHVQARLLAALTGLQGQALHAGRLSLDHPVTGERLEFAAPPPYDLAKFLEVLADCFPDDPSDGR
jgi:23S rRNA pseudouridine1911/1915/1917 synthase